MSNIELVETKEIKGGDKFNKIMNKKLLKNQKGFSLVELLIVIAIMGVLAVIAFNMFGGVLSSSKKSADKQQADNLGRAVLAYCIETNDWDLSKATSSPSAAAGDLDLDEKKPTEIFRTLAGSVYIGTKKYGPYVTLKDPTKAANHANNDSVFVPQWSTTSGGNYLGWSLNIYTLSQTVTCEPLEAVAAAPGVTAVTEEKKVNVDGAH